MLPHGNARPAKSAPYHKQHLVITLDSYIEAKTGFEGEHMTWGIHCDR